jgi:hypothetical protein
MISKDMKTVIDTWYTKNGPNFSESRAVVKFLFHWVDYHITNTKHNARAKEEIKGYVYGKCFDTWEKNFAKDSDQVS